MDEKIMAPEELHLDSPELKPGFGSTNKLNAILGQNNPDSRTHSQSLSEGDSSDDSMPDLDIEKSNKNKNQQQHDEFDDCVKKVFGVAYSFAKDKRGLEEFYNKQLRVKYMSKMRKTLLLLNILIGVQEVLLWINYKENEDLTAFRVAVLLWIVASLIFLFLSNKVYKFAVLTLISVKSIILLAELYTLRISRAEYQERIDLAFYNFVYQSMLDSLIFISVGNFCSLPGIFPVTLLSVLNSISYLCIIMNTVILKINDPSMPTLIIMVTFFYFFNFIDLFNHFHTELTLFFNYIKIEKKGYYLNTFVDRLMPKHIKISSSTTEILTEVTLLFADIVGFTEYSAGKNPRQVVEMLSQLFTAFDKECNKLNLYKLYTIGDCYVVMSFLDKNNRKKPSEEANDVLQLSMFMINSIAEVRKKINFDKLNMRIGIHTGTMYGGIIGTDIVRYDLYGPDVLTANKMESNGIPGRIKVSETTRKLLDELEKTNYTFENSNEIEIKVLNKKFKSYFLITGSENKDE